MYPYPWFWNVLLYGVMSAVGLLACFAVLYAYMKKWKVKESFVDFIFFNGVASVIVGFGSAAVFQGFYNYLDNPEEGFHLDGGITFLGGLIGGVVCFLAVYFVVVCWLKKDKYKIRLYQVISIIPCCILVGHAFGRIGCFFAGCCHGIQTDSIFGVQFPELPYRVYPTQLYEAIFLFLLFGVCSLLALKKNFQHNMSVYLIAYGIFRFLIEYLRGDSRGSFIPGISPSQAWSIAMVIGGIGLIFLQRALMKKVPAYPMAAELNAELEAELKPIATAETLEVLQGEKGDTESVETGVTAHTGSIETGNTGENG